ncbi:uncharacterized protein LOC122086869 [Macadamia integrifolia]|uniref:uncharacterized protein LOC122086869 n=1 Tax=Macadamia integrifolia TaxID=60698 RepID=UPI001C4E43AC|nr:uncharacterized protein LOC122086869 [Macadamia integrifolia]
MTPQSQVILLIPMDNVKVIKTFQKFRPPYFGGIAQDPLTPAKWVEGMEKAFKVMTLIEEQKLIVRERKETEFMELKQGSNSVLEYQQDFEKLFFFGPEHLKGDQAKAKRFEKRLRPTIGVVLLAQYLHGYAQVVQPTKSIEDKQRENYHAIQGKRTAAPSRFGKGTYSSAASSQYGRPEIGQAPPPPRPMVAQSQTVPLRCFVCQQMGHFAKNCSQRRPGDPYVGPTKSVQPLSATHPA